MSQEALRRGLEVGTLQTVLDSAESARSIRTWDANLSRDERLLVPVDVRALVASATTVVSRVPTVTEVVVDAETWPTPPTPFATETPRPAGVYVHVAMPDGLTRGARRSAGQAIPAGNPLAMPSLPDRILIVRLLHRSAKRRAWVLLADEGRRVALEDYIAEASTEQSRTLARGLTAVTGGDPAWAATFDAVENRYALYDDLSDLSDAERSGGRASYLVAGFWSNEDLDPLHGLTTIGGFENRLEQLGWFAPPLPRHGGAKSKTDHAMRATAGVVGKEPVGAFTAIDAPAMPQERVSIGVDPSWTGVLDVAGILQLEPLFPTKTLLHGVVFGVPFDGHGPDLRPSGESIDVAVGGSGLSALAALLAGGTSEERLSQERLLSAFFAQLLDRVDTADGLADVDEARHAMAFTGLAGGQKARPDRIGDAARSAPTEKATTDTELVFGRKRGAVKHTRPSRATAPGPRTFRDVAVALPRFFVPNDPAIVIRGGRRSERHGGDTRYAEDGRLHCRFPHEIARGYAGVLDAHELPASLLTLGSGALPPECNALFAEAVLTDPFRATELATWANHERKLPIASLQERFEAEMMLRNMPVVDGMRRESLILQADADQLRRASLLDGVDPSPVATTLWAQPWIPLWLDYELELDVEDESDDFVLRSLDLEPQSTPSGDGERLTARVLLSGTSATGLAAQIRRWLEEEDKRDAAGQGMLAENEEAELAALADAADGVDVLTGALAGLRRHLLGLDPRSGEVSRLDPAGNLAGRPPPLAAPRLFPSGRARLARARLVDAFGRVVELPAAVLARIELAATHTAPEGNGEIILRPRFQTPARVLFRFVDPAVSDSAPPAEARVDQETATGGVSPVAGWLLPDHVDEALELFDVAGEPLGQLMHDALTGAVVWEGAPGRPGPLGHAPDGGATPSARHLERFAVGLIAADARARQGAAPPESALAALLRAVDTTLWTVDPFHHFGTGSVAGLVGRPIAVVRATLELEVTSDVSETSFVDAAQRAEREAAFAKLVSRVVRARLGELTRADDGLLAYAIDDDYTSMRLVAGDVRGRARSAIFGEPDAPIHHPYVSGASEIELRPKQLVRLTMLMVPGASVSLTTGVLPRKRIAMAREWFTAVLDRLSPSFRVGPVLLDPGTVRLPKVSGLGKNQRFTHKPTALDWRDDPIEAATQTAYLPELPSMIREGWIRVGPAAEEETTP